MDTGDKGDELLGQERKNSKKLLKELGEELGEELKEELEEKLENNEEEEESVREGFENHASVVNNSNQRDLVTEQMLITIMDRLDKLERKINSCKSDNKNVHDVILFIIIGVFILFALDSIFRLGRLTV